MAVIHGLNYIIQKDMDSNQAALKDKIGETNTHIT